MQTAEAENRRRSLRRFGRAGTNQNVQTGFRSDRYVFAWIRWDIYHERGSPDAETPGSDLHGSEVFAFSARNRQKVRGDLLHIQACCTGNNRGSAA